MTTIARWRKAQTYEQGFWEGVAQRAAEGSYEQIAFYQWRAGEISKRFRALDIGDVLNDTSRVIELGSGPVGVLPYLPGVERVAVDPLHHYYASNPKLTELRSPEVLYLEAPGESVPLPDSAYHLVIMENCIDHVRDVDAVMREITRLLRPNGLLYLTVNARSRIGFLAHRILAKLSLDPGHPHTFTERRFAELLERHRFQVLHSERGSWWKAWREDLAAEQWKHKAKGLLGVSEYLLLAIARKEG